ncbi:MULTISPECIES: ketohydroxyglutarate aldolase [Enterococcus]|uniref:KDPG and KHG aldolase n=1 Tax=Enterococcus casseliflavus ATCC 12755 TaxID=888066 RepID=F0ELM5_ENTCA|nr:MULTISPECIES: ketohydroxyglutarate aldolase [Enterococcus]AMG50782.1 ketohydroxyglutarate aldolase [Enterococcus gallinarum]MBO1097477.1 ketohydroxyglutarate aldolase [Enterococcus casseliflavus]EGC68959.1 KDPG and KHG aldolase [Enterococcus casseliflavus ATCC 12755]EJF49496.1 4-hydroxy-2-oxoglutarate aldolase [Enterococcus sp. C1]MBO1144603.1 ketohydroxyglutarate aldolase [Enterococcus casseliflavus]
MIKAENTMRIFNTGIMAVVRVETIERGIEVAKGCLDGGVDVMEISYTNNNAGEVIRAIKATFGDQILIGAGTVLESTTARLAIMDGAEFVIAPTYDQGVQELCNLYQIPYAPGCTSYTEMMEALKNGASFIKAFPISNYYGPSLAKVIKVPVPHTPILASGGATLENLHEWFENGVDCIGIGGLLTKGTSEEIAQNAQKLTAIVSEVRGK